MNKRTLSSLFTFSVVLLFVAQFSQAQTIPDPIGAGSFKELILLVTQGVATVIAPLVVIMFIVAGILYLTSAGNPERMKSAKTCIVYAIVGTAIIISAEGIAIYIDKVLH
ncbi:MAG: hypothetical protein WC845_00495 [Candidatus Staskawiczbacteria bacterium]|jgi:hypothetical protein